MNYKQAIAQIKSAYDAALVKADLNYEHAITADSELYSLEKQKRELICKSAYNEDCDRQINLIENKIKQRLKEKYGNLDKFYPPHNCTLCNDTGICKGKICECAIRLAVSDTDNIELPMHDFAEAKETAPPELKVTYEQLKAFCDKFPDTKLKNIVLMGGTGTGKTYLMGCIAKEIALKGSIIFLTAYGLNKRFISYHTTFDETKNDFFDPLIDTDALIIDDLGSESITKNVTCEYLYTLINERTLRNKVTMITTNLDMNGIKDRYGDKTASRIFDKNICYAKILKGYNLRNI